MILSSFIVIIVIGICVRCYSRILLFKEFGLDGGKAYYEAHKASHTSWLNLRQRLLNTIKHPRTMLLIDYFRERGNWWLTNSKQLHPVGF